MHECDRRTDGRTDRRTNNAIAASVATAGASKLCDRITFHCRSVTVNVCCLTWTRVTDINVKHEKVIMHGAELS